MAGAAGLGIGAQGTEGEGRGGRQPNIVLVLTDDQGYGDLGCHGNDRIITPNLDQLRAQGADFTRFYASPVCAPTRASLMTGRYNYRTGVVDTWLGRAMMHPDEVTIAEILRQAGYRTGVFGKWHLGDNHPMRPYERGFDEALVHKGGGIGQPADPPGTSYWDPILDHNGRLVRCEGYCTDIFTDACLRFIRDCRGGPFFAYLATNTPHTPVEVAERYVVPYRAMGWDEENAGVLGMVTNIDENIGHLMAGLARLGLAEDTLLIFMGDNGPQQDRYRCGLRGLKGSVYEGGIRVPFLVRWPGRITPGSEVGAMLAHIDVAPTLAELAGALPPTSMDGWSFAPLLRGEPFGPPDRTLFFQWHRGDAPELYRDCAAVDRRYKLVNGRELYDLQNDPSEARDIASEHSGRVASMRASYETWFADVSATRGYEPPRIYLNTPYENPVTLTRQDWRGPRASWADDGLGYWEVDVRWTGKADITLRIAELAEPARARVRLGAVELQAPVGAGTAVHTFHSVTLPQGPARLEAWLERGGEQWGVLYVDVTRLPAHRAAD